jgi:hypothetical protein
MQLTAQRSRRTNAPRPAAYRPRLEFLEDRRPLGDGLLSALLGWSLLEPGLALLDAGLPAAPAEPPAASPPPGPLGPFSASAAHDGGAVLARPPAPLPSPAGQAELPAGPSVATFGERDGGLARLAAGGFLPREARPRPSAAEAAPAGLPGPGSVASLPPEATGGGAAPAAGSPAAPGGIEIPPRPGAARPAGQPGSGASRAPAAAAGLGPGQEARVRASYGRLPLSFEANAGQTDPRVQFLAHGPGYTLFLTPTEAVLALSQPAPAGGLPATPRAGPLDRRGAAAGPPVAADTAVVRMQIHGGSAAPRAAGLEELPGTVNYLLGNDRGRWHTDIATHARVEYRGVYPGIDLAYYGNQQRLEYDFVVAPGADPGAIRLGYAGADRPATDGQGDLVLHTAGGDLVQHRPLLYQEVNGVRHEVSGGYVVRGQEVGFRVGGYDAGRPLIIDPVLSYSTYLGGSGEDYGYGIAVDAAGNAYVTGKTTSVNFPTANPSQPANGGGTDAFVAKLNASGSALVYSTYLGGSGGDAGLGIAVDAAGNAYVTGSTTSTNFPTANPLQPALGSYSPAFKSTNGGGNWSASGTGLPNSVTITTLAIDPLTPSTLYAGTDASGVFKSTNGGSSWSAVNTGLPTNLGITALAIDPLTPSTLYAGTSTWPYGGVYKSINGGGNWSAAGLDGLYVTALAVDPATPATLYAGTWLGGAFKSTDGGSSWSDIDNGLPYTGFGGSSVTALALNPVTPSTLYVGVDYLDLNGYGDVQDFYGVFMSTDGGGSWSQSLFSFTPVSALAVDPVTPSTLYASKSLSAGNFRAVYKSTNSGSTWKVSDTGLPDYVAIATLVIDPGTPATLYAATSTTWPSGGVYKSINGGGNWSATSLDNLSVTALAVNPVTPSTLYAGVYSSFPTSNAFVAELNASGSALVYSTYLGGGGRDVGSGIAVDGSGNAYVTGSTTSFNFPTANPLQPANGGGPDAFVAKLNAGGSALVYSTYLGGSGDDGGSGIAVDGAGNAYVTGATTSTNFPTANPLQPTYGGGYFDAFVAKLSASGSALAYSTYLGGSSWDEGNGIAVDGSGNAYVTGTTASTNFPTANPLQPTKGGGADAFVAKIT